MSSPGPVRRKWISCSPSATTPRAKCARYWPGQPMTAHWGLPDPAAVGGSDEQKRRAFAEAFRHLAHRINIVHQPAARQARPAGLQQKLKEIGKTGSEEPQA